MSTKQLEKFSTEVKIPENVKVNFKSHMLNVDGPLGNTYKNFKKMPVDIEVNGDHDNDADTNFGVDNTIEIDMVEISNNGEIRSLNVALRRLKAFLFKLIFFGTIK